MHKTVPKITAAHTCGAQPTVNLGIRHDMSTCQAKACDTHSAILAHLARWLRMRPHDLYITHLVKHNASMHQVPPAMRQPLSRREGGLWPLRARTHPCCSVARGYLSPIIYSMTLSARWPPSHPNPKQQNDTAACGASRATWAGGISRSGSIYVGITTYI